MGYTDFLTAWRDGTDPELAALKLGGVKAIRAKTGLSQRAFAERYGIPRRSIENWETKTEISEYTLALIAFAVLSK